MGKSEKENNTPNKKPEKIESKFNINRVTPGFNLVEIPGMKEKIEHEWEIYHKLYDNNYDKIMRDVNYLLSEHEKWGSINRYLILAYGLRNTPRAKLNSKSLVEKLEKEIARRTRIQKVSIPTNDEKGQNQRKTTDPTISVRELEESTRIIDKLKMHWPGNSQAIIFLFKSLFQFDEELSDEELLKLLKKYFVINRAFDGSLIKDEEMIQWPSTVLGIIYLFDQLSSFTFFNLVGEYTDKLNKFIETYFKNKKGERFKNLYKFSAKNIRYGLKKKIERIILHLNEINANR